jgi:hypothetical protein
VGWSFDRAPYPDGVPTIGDEMALGVRPEVASRRDDTGVEVIDGQVVVTIGGGDQAGSGDE